MWIVTYGIRILGMFPVEMDAKNYMHEIINYDSRYPKVEYLETKFYPIAKAEFLNSVQKDLVENLRKTVRERIERGDMIYSQT